MAQAQYYSQRRGMYVCPHSSGMSRFSSSPTTHNEGQGIHAHFIIYSAVVTATLLERFRASNKTPTSDAGLGMKITCSIVKVSPILGLQEVLAKALAFIKQEKD